MDAGEDAPARRDAPYLVAERFLPQVIDDAPGVRDRPAREPGKFGQLLVESLPVGTLCRRHQGIGDHGDTEQALADGVIHLPGYTGPLGRDRCAYRVRVTRGS